MDTISIQEKNNEQMNDGDLRGSVQMNLRPRQSTRVFFAITDQKIYYTSAKQKMNTESFLSHALQYIYKLTPNS